MSRRGPAHENIHAPPPISIGTQMDDDLGTPTGGLRGSMTIGRMRIHDGVLTDAQVAANYNEEKSAFVEPSPPARHH